MKRTEKVREVKVRTRTTVEQGGKVRTVERTRIKREKTRTTAKDARLRFGNGNAKLDAAIFTFSLPAGWSCPFARDCQAKAHRRTGRITDGPETEFRCYAASMEARLGSVRDSRWHNYDLLRGKSTAEMVRLILDSLTPYAGYVRVHDSGDFFSQDHLDAWLEVARQRPRTTLYFYTKSVRFWVARLEEVGNGHTPGLVPNFVPTASRGGRHDHFIDAHGLRSAVVVYSEQEAADRGLPIDHDDSHAITHGPVFALLLHGTQPGGTEAAKAVAALRAQGEFGYGQRAEEIRQEHGRMPLTMVN